MRDPAPAPSFSSLVPLVTPISEVGWGKE